MSKPPTSNDTASGAATIGGAVRVAAFGGFGTLFDFQGAVRACPGLAAEQAGALAALWQAKQFEYAWLSTLSQRSTDFWHITGEALDHAMGVLGLGSLLLRTRLMQMMLHLPPFADAAAGMAAVRAAGLQAAILSNASSTMLISAAKAIGMFERFDALLPAEEAQVFKPHPDAYQLIARRFRESPEHVLYVGASAWDVAGAVRAGFRAVWLNRTGAQAEHPWAPPAAEIRALSELPALLPAPAATPTAAA
ncbi:MAG: haloacid dehalogenase type II [Alphaproteobacteria bacterium]|nr:haloacid dehalogenase type II [Alphaproteobacteria bacterium]